MNLDELGSIIEQTMDNPFDECDVEFDTDLLFSALAQNRIDLIWLLVDSNAFKAVSNETTISQWRAFGEKLERNIKTIINTIPDKQIRKQDVVASLKILQQIISEDRRYRIDKKSKVIVKLCPQEESRFCAL